MQKLPHFTHADAHLEQRRLEINAVLAGEKDESVPRPPLNSFGPTWGFASLGDYYGQNAPGFRWPKGVKHAT